MEQHYARIYVVCTGIYFKRWGKIFKSYDDIESNLNLQQQQEKKKRILTDYACILLFSVQNFDWIQTVEMYALLIII